MSECASVAVEEVSVCECKQNKSQTGQNSHLAVEPSAPAHRNVLIISNISLAKIFYFALFRCSCQQSHEDNVQGGGLVRSTVCSFFFREIKIDKCANLKLDTSDRLPAPSFPADSSSLLKPLNGLIFLPNLPASPLTELCVCLCSEQSDPGCGTSSGGDQLYRVPPPPGKISAEGSGLIQQQSDH